MLLVRVVEIGAVETADGDGEDELQETEDEVEDEDREGCGAAGADGGCGLLVEAGECHRGCIFWMILLASAADSAEWALKFGG